MADLGYTIPGLGSDDSRRLVQSLQDRLHAMNDLHLTLKHAHWNVTGSRFIAVHEMLDPQVDLVRGYADDIAERIAQLGASPVGTPGLWSAIAAGRTTPWARPTRRTTCGRWTRSTTA